MSATPQPISAAAELSGSSEPVSATGRQVVYGGGRGVVTGVDYGYGRVAGYGAVGNRGLGYAGHFYG